MEMNVMGREFKRTSRKKETNCAHKKYQLQYNVLNGGITCKIPLIIISGIHFTTFLVFLFFFSCWHFVLLFGSNAIIISSKNEKPKKEI